MKGLLNMLKWAYNWVGTDGFLHFLVCYALMLTFQPIVGVWWSLLIVIIPALLKEAWDYFVDKDNNVEQVLHDLICDGVGIAAALITILIWIL